MPNISLCQIKNIIPVIIGLLLFLGAHNTQGQSNLKPTNKKYLTLVETFANTLLDKGRDTYGPQKTAMWCALIDTRDYSVPTENIPAIPGMRNGDRALGGSNLYHDVYTLHSFRVLSAITGNPRYRQAADAYLKDFLELTQHPKTGLLAWGEHLYYNVYTDAVDINQQYKKDGKIEYFHELIEVTPPWHLLWAINPDRTQKAITGLQYHFHDPELNTYLYNRHATWDQPLHQTGGQPWIKHSALYAQALKFIYARNPSASTQNWANGIGNLYWNSRNPTTNLTLSCIGDPRVHASNAGLSSMSTLAYWLLKAAQESPGTGKEMRQRANIMLTAIDQYAWNPEKKIYYEILDLAGKPLPEEDSKTGEPATTSPWSSGYGSTSLLNHGRVAAYFARNENKKKYLPVAERIALLAEATPLPPKYIPQNLAEAIHLNLDLYDLTQKPNYLQTAQRYADLSIQKFWRNNLITRQLDDPYYEAKAGSSDLLASWLRLHLRLNPATKDPKMYDWSF